MIAAENERNEIVVERGAHHGCEAGASFGDFIEIFGVFDAVVLLFGLPDGDIANVFDVPAQLLEARLKSGDAQSGRAHIDAAAAGAEIHGHSDNTNLFSHGASRYWV